MLWRYVNIQICPGQPVPTRAELISVEDSGGFAVPSLPYTLTTDGAVLGPLQKFWICTECGEAPTWYLEDGITLAEAGQIPNCWEPCGTLALTDSPPDRACQFFFATACDNQNDPDPTSWIQDVTRRTTVCNGETIDVSYFSADPADPTSLIDYDLIGAFVDCASGLPIEDDVPSCDDFEYIGNLWKLEGDLTPSTLVEWWADPAGPLAGTGVAHDNVSNIFTNNGKTLSHSSGAADRSYIAASFSVEGTNTTEFINGVGVPTTADTSGTDQGKLSAHFVLPADALLRDGGTRTGERGGLWLNRCCKGDLELLEERTTDTTSADRGVFNGTVVPQGIHYAEAAISDLSAWWNLTLEASFDGGATYEPLIGYAAKPRYECRPVVRCKDTGLLFDGETFAPITVSKNDVWCEPVCVPSSGADSTTGVGDSPTAQEIADWQNEGGTVSLNVPPGTRGCITSITDYGTGAVYWTIDGSTPSAANGSTMSVQYGNAFRLCGLDLSLVRLAGSSNNSDFSITYEIWN
jgi:hypothetical protein